MALAIHESDADLDHKGVHRLQSAIDIARAQLVKYGYLTPGSLTGPLEEVRLTPKGRERNLKHANHDRVVKTYRFDLLYGKLLAANPPSTKAPAKDTATTK